MCFEEIINNLIEKKDLDKINSLELMNSIMNKQYNDVQIGALLTALNSKGVTSGELSCFVKSLKNNAKKINPKNEILIDTCGTGGDNAHTFNISTLTALILCACGVGVAKHGGKSVSSKCGSADILEYLGVNINLSPVQTEKSIEEIGFGFLYAPNYHLAFKNVSSVRKQLGIKTIFNMLGPLLNPAKLSHQMIGVYNPELTELYADTLKKIGMNHAISFHGAGLDEISLYGQTKVSSLKKGKIENFYLSPADFGLQKCNPKLLKTHKISDNADFFLSVLKGKNTPATDIVLMNSAAGLVLCDLVDNYYDAMFFARDSLYSGLTYQKFCQMREYSNDFKN